MPATILRYYVLSLSSLTWEKIFMNLANLVNRIL